MHQRIAEAERKIGFETAQSGNSAGYVPRLFDFHERLTDEWVGRLYAAHCRAWNEQNRSVSPKFIRAIRDRPIADLIAARKSAVEAAVRSRGTRIGEQPNPIALRAWNLQMRRLARRWNRKLEADAVATEYATPPNTKKAEPARRVNPTSAAFDKFAGRLMHKAHLKFIAQGWRATKGRTSPNLPFLEFLRVVRQVDEKLINGTPRFPLREVLTEGVWKRIADYNQRCSKGSKTIKTFADAAKNPEFKRQIRYRFNRAEIFYRQHFVQEKS
jgi:hypothetical protein